MLLLVRKPTSHVMFFLSQDCQDLHHDGGCGLSPAGPAAGP